MPVMEAIQTQRVESPVSSITFSSIPSTYRHLQFRFCLSSDYMWAAYKHMEIQLGNGSVDTAARYHRFATGANNTTGTNELYGGQTKAMVRYIGARQGPSGVNFGSGCVDIYDYANTNKDTNLNYYIGWNGYAVGYYYVQYGGIHWESQAASMSTVDIVKFTIESANDFAIGSVITMYGMAAS